MVQDCAKIEKDVAVYDVAKLRRPLRVGKDEMKSEAARAGDRRLNNPQIIGVGFLLEVLLQSTDSITTS